MLHVCNNNNTATDSYYIDLNQIPSNLRLPNLYYQSRFTVISESANGIKELIGGVSNDRNQYSIIYNRINFKFGTCT